MIAITGYGHAEIKERCLNAGFDHFFLKPTDPADILSVLRQYADQLS
jgi:CheY-like chemotaxis protein